MTRPATDPAATPARPWDARAWVLIGVLVIGAVVLSQTFRVEDGTPWFYALAAGVGIVWITGGILVRPRLPVLSGPSLPAGRAATAGALGGVALVLVFVLAGLLATVLPWAESSVDAVLRYAQGSGLAIVLITVFTATCEEYFFRGVLYDQLEERWPGPVSRLPAIGALGAPVLLTTLAYVLVTAASGNWSLVLAAAALGLVVGRQRQVTGGLLAPVLTHVIWSVSMILVLPPILG